MSPYRLAAHLTSAAVIYGTLLWTTLSLAYPLSPAAALPAGSAAQAGVNALRRWAHPLAGLIAVTALSGGANVLQNWDVSRRGVHSSLPCSTSSGFALAGVVIAKPSAHMCLPVYAFLYSL